jgi:hypothetical protein
MFGPLNGVRTALVIVATLTAVAAAALGYWVAALVLAAAVAIHGLGWWYLWKDATRRAAN